MKTIYTINEKDFLFYYKNLLISIYLDDIKPSVTGMVRSGDTEIYKNYDQWIYSEMKKVKNVKMLSIYNKKLTYYRNNTFLEWARRNKSAIFSAKFPRSRKPEVESYPIDCWFSYINLQYTKGSCSFSIFLNTEKDRKPHIPNYYILYYSTNCNNLKVEYTFNDLELVAGNLNHASYEDEF